MHGSERVRRQTEVNARSRPEPAPREQAASVLALQRTAGNQAVIALLRRGTTASTEQRVLQRSPASELIDEHTHLLNLREEELAGDLRKRMPGEADLVVAVFETLSWTDRDDVAVAMLEKATDEELKAWGADSGGRRALTRVIAELSSGWTTGGEGGVRDRAMRAMGSDMPAAGPGATDAPGTAPMGEPGALIEKHTHGLNLREHELAKDLVDHLLAGRAGFVNGVFDALDSSDRDDVAYEIMEAATDDQIKTIARDSSGLVVLRRMVQEMFHGVATGSEEGASQRLMRLITEVQREGAAPGAVVEVEVVTYLTGGLDFIGTLIGSRGHTAIMIGDNAYSFELGWSAGMSRADYLRKNRNRNGVGQVLKISDEDVRKIQDGLNDAAGTGYYAVSGDICTDSSAIALEKALGTLKKGWIPADFVGYLDATGKVAGHRFYPKEESAETE